MPWSTDSHETVKSPTNLQCNFTDGGITINYNNSHTCIKVFVFVHESEFISEEAQSYMRLAHLDDKHISMLPADEEILAAGGEVYTWSWEDMLQYPLLGKVIKNTVRKIDTEYDSELTSGDKGGRTNIVKRLKQPEKVLQLGLKTNISLNGSDCLNSQMENLKEGLKRETQSPTSSGYSSYHSTASNKSANRSAKNSSHLLEEIKAMNVVSMQLCPHAVTVDHTATLPKMQVETSDGRVMSSHAFPCDGMKVCTSTSFFILLVG